MTDAPLSADPRPAVRLGMPGYAGLTGAAAKGFWLACTPGRFAIKRHAVEDIFNFPRVEHEFFFVGRAAVDKIPVGVH